MADEEVSIAGLVDFGFEIASEEKPRQLWQGFSIDIAMVQNKAPSRKIALLGGR